MAIDLDRFWDDNDDQPKQPGVDKEQIASWEALHGVTLPKVLRAALRRQNGGQVRYSRVRVLPLDEIVPVEDEFWEYARYSKKTVLDRALVFTFAWEGDQGDEPRLMMNFNANGIDGEPTIHYWYHDPGEVRKAARTLQRFFAELLAVSPTPDVDWSETERLDMVLHRETIDLKREYDGQPAHEEIVLGRLNKVLVLFTHDVSPHGETYTKTTVPEPLDKSSASIEDFRPSPTKTYQLQLEPRDSDGIVNVESERTADNKWKNSIEHGVPVYVSVESRSKDKLKALRETIFGKKAAKKAEEHDDTQAEMLRRFESLDPDQRQAAGAELALQMLEQNEDLLEGEEIDDEDVPPELREASEKMRLMMEGMKQKAKDTKDKRPPDPEVSAIADLMSQVMRQAEEMEDEDDDEDEEDDPPPKRKKKS